VIALVIIVFLDAQDAGTPLAGALSRAMEQALGGRATTTFEQAPPRDAEAARLDKARAAGASFGVRLQWEDAARLQARVQVVELATGRVETRAVLFEPGDALIERGRTLGLLVAAVIDPESSGRGERGPPAAPPVPRAEPARPAAEVARQPAPPPPPAESRWAVDAAAEGGFALGGAGSGVGGTAGLRRMVLPRWGLRLGARARFGQVGVAQSSSSALAFSLGAIFMLARPDERHRLGLTLRAEAMLLHESLTHLSSDDPAPVRQGRPLPGASLLAEAQWSLSPSVGLLLAAGPEVAFGRTSVFVGPAQVAELSPYRFLVQLGLLARF
jgi:hypothetical protein